MSRLSRLHYSPVVVAAFVIAAPARVRAQAAPTAQSMPVVSTSAQGQPPQPPYSLPFQLRGAGAGSIVRLDTSFAFFEGPTGDSGSTQVSLLTAAYLVAPGLSPFLRLGLAHHSPPGSGDGATPILSPLVGAVYGLRLAPEWRLAAFLGFVVPIGSGGGNDPDPNVRAALGGGALARAAMDNALFAPNYLTVAPGIDLAYVNAGLTVQAEATLFQLARTRGDDIDTDSSRTNSTYGLHVGYFVLPFLSLGAELRHQRWLSTPSNVEVNEDLRDNTTVAFGPRLHFKLTNTLWARPAIAYSRGLDKPMTDLEYNIVQLDLAFPF